MAEFLVFAENRVRLDVPPEASTALLKRGDITEVRPDGFVWGREESKAVWVAEGRDPTLWPGKTILIKVPGMPVPARHKIVRGHTRLAVVTDPEFNAPDPQDRYITQHKYVWRVNLRSIPPQARKRLVQDREITVTRAQFRRHVDHKVTRAMFDERRSDGQGRRRTGAELREVP